MPTKITPLPKVGGGGGGGAAGKGVTKPAMKSTNTKSANTKSAVNPSRFTSNLTSRFTVAKRGLSKETAARGKGYLHAIIFTTCVGLGLLILGIFFVYKGDDEYIVDVMVLGGLCIVMGTGSLLLGCFFTLRPICRERRNATVKKEPTRASQPPGSASIQNDYINPAFVMDVLTVPQPVASTSTSTPVNNDLYDRSSLGATQTVLGKLVPPSPPPLSQPIHGREGTTSTELTTIDHGSDEVSNFEWEDQTVR